MSDQPKTIFEKDEQIDEATYMAECVEYALEMGFVKEEDQKRLEESYLKPIHQIYRQAIAEVMSEIGDEQNTEEFKTLLTKRLNAILERTKRIGTTDPNNIMRSISDYISWACKTDTYIEYASECLAQKVLDVLHF
jgi:aspartyl/asparaginyl-tRNA synthetase